MRIKIQSALDSLNFIKQCRKYDLSVWQCPQFLFLILGLVVIVSSIAIYFIGTRYSDSPEIIALIVLTVAVFLMAIGFTITRSFEKLAEVARLKSEFISIVSHQLRSPLANLRWVIDLLVSGNVKPNKEKELSYLQILRENSARMEELISDLLVISRIETGGFSFKKQVTSLNGLIEKIIVRFSPLAQASNIKVVFNIPPNFPAVLIDPSHISLVMENLLDNAIRYIKEKGSVDISVSQKSGSFRVEFKDNGIGISEEDKKYIFQKFFRGENAFKQQTQGSGLGLYIARLVIEKSGGKIGFVSKIGEGTTFWFTLPIK